MRLPVICLECGKKFLTAKMRSCPKCGGSDIEPSYMIETITRVKPTPAKPVTERMLNEAWGV